MGNIDSIEERRQAELLGAISQPASVYFAPQIAPMPIKDTIGSANSADSISTRTSRPVLDPPKPIELDTFVKGRNGMTNLLRQPIDKPQMDVDDMLHEMLLSIIQQSSSYLQVKRNFFDTERTFSDVQEQERTEHMKTQLNTSKNVGTWNTVEKSLVSFGLIAAGIAGIATGNVPLGVTAVVVGTLLVIDQVLEDKAKVALASWMARGEQEQERMWLDRIQLFCAVTSLGLSLGLAAPAAVSMGSAVAGQITLAMSTARGVASGVKSVHEWRYTTQKELATALDLACTLAQKSVNRVVFDIQEICNTLYQLYENMHQVEEKREQIARLMLRLPNM